MYVKLLGMLIDFLKQNNIQYEENVPLKKKTWIKTGGIARLWITPENVKSLIKLGRYLYNEKKEFEIVGYTSNLFFTNDYNPQIIISTVKLKGVIETDTGFVCECGVQIAKFARERVEKGQSGFSGMINLPGTIGAAVHNNAGCFGLTISDSVEAIEFLTVNGDVVRLNKDDLKYSHRSSALKRKEVQGIILNIHLKKNANSTKECESKLAICATQKRKATQELPYRNLGSVYANLKYRLNLINVTCLILKKILQKIGIFKNYTRFFKVALLTIYRYKYLDVYISDKDINTFIWHDEYAEEMFIDYQKFMNKVYKSPTLEIEIKK